MLSADNSGTKLKKGIIIDMDNIMGKPTALKQVNLSLVRKAIMDSGSATRAEIVAATKISVTTVRSLLTEMLENNELVEVGYDRSAGGRKATRYKLNKDRFYGVALCLGDQSIRYITVNICGEIQQQGTLEIEDSIFYTICSFLDKLVTQVEIKSIGIGVPGIVHGLEYVRKNSQGVLEKHLIGELIRSRYGLPVILENDLNAITLGFGRCYLNEYPEERRENVNMAFIYFERTCVSGGFLVDGRILRGWNNFVGEFGLFPVGDHQTLDDLLASPITDERYAKAVASMVAAICCMVNPQYIALGGVGFRKSCLPLIAECFANTLPDEMSAELLYAEDVWHDYLGGMAYLTSQQIFADILLVKG